MRERIEFKKIGESCGAASLANGACLSNRVIISTKNSQNSNWEPKFILRVKRMSEAVRLITHMAHHIKTKSIVAPFENFTWEEFWEESMSPLPPHQADERWLSVYYKGEIIWQTGPVNPAINLLEALAAKSDTSYEEAVGQLSNLLAVSHQAQIEQQIQPALYAFRDKKNIFKGSIIMRKEGHASIFSVRIKPQSGGRLGKAPDIRSCLNILAAVLEGREAIVEAERYSATTKARSKAKEKLLQVSKIVDEVQREINQYSRIFEVRFRPEMPQFTDYIDRLITESGP